MLVELGSVKVEAQVDSGADRNVMREDVFKKLSADYKKNFGQSDSVLAGAGGPIKLLGNVCVPTRIAGAVYNLVYAVLPAKDMPSPLLIGDPILNYASVKLQSDGPKVTPLIGQSYIQLKTEEQQDVSTEITAHLVEPYRSAAAEMIKNYSPKDLPADEAAEVKLHIKLKETRPIYCHPRRLSPEAEDAVNPQIEEWTERGIVRKSESEYAAPIVVVKKKDGLIRTCIDYTEFNKVVEKQRFPVPVIEESVT